MKKGIFQFCIIYSAKRSLIYALFGKCAGRYAKLSNIFWFVWNRKTTLSTDPYRPLIGDDEHGWSDDGIFNFEGGCYAKVINLNPKEEPDIFNAIREEALLENVVFDKDTLEIDFSDGSKPKIPGVLSIEHINNSIACKGMPSMANHPEKLYF